MAARRLFVPGRAVHPGDGDVVQAEVDTKDRAVVASAALFVQELVCQLQVLRNTIQKYDKQIEAIAQQHPDFPIVNSFPGIGKALAPRLIAALGTQRERFPDARSI